MLSSCSSNKVHFCYYGARKNQELTPQIIIRQSLSERARKMKWKIKKQKKRERAETAVKTRNQSALENALMLFSSPDLNSHIARARVM
jgi:hypothetical protein